MNTPHHAAERVAAGGQPRTPQVGAAESGVLPSSMLLRGRETVQIEHNGALYQLRSTRLGKLILTK